MERQRGEWVGVAGVEDKLRVQLPLGWSALVLGGLALVTGLGWLYLGLVREIDDMVRSTVAQFMGTLPFFIGLGIFSFRRACDIDRANVRVTKWWGLLWPWSRHVFGLGQFDKVTLRQEPRQLGSRRKPKLITEYPVRLEGEKRLPVRVDLPEDKARALAREIADYLDLPLESTLPEETEGDKAQ
ncbi:hypothetical protein OAF45_02350 [Candidatus Latescibacteria bacterium]|nr:hypothetical protein [Candidatus Latescibacterota bacterium]